MRFLLRHTVTDGGDRHCLDLSTRLAPHSIGPTESRVMVVVMLGSVGLYTVLSSCGHRELGCCLHLFGPHLLNRRWMPRLPKTRKMPTSRRPKPCLLTVMKWLKSCWIPKSRRSLEAFQRRLSFASHRVTNRIHKLSYSMMASGICMRLVVAFLVPLLRGVG